MHLAPLASGTHHTIVFKQIVHWSDLFSMFSQAYASLSHATHNITLTNFTGLQIKAIFCPGALCPTLNISYQGDFDLLGGICGVDIFPTSNDGNERMRLFLLPTLHRNGSLATEGPRGVVASLSGIVFDLAGGSQGSLQIQPQIGDHYHVVSNRSLKHNHDHYPTIINGLHGNARTYGHMVNQVLPRVHLVSDYLGKYLNYPGNHVALVSHGSEDLMSTVDNLLGWNLANFKQKGYPEGNFVLPRSHLVLEAVEHVISLVEVAPPTRPFVKSAKACVLKTLLAAARVANTTNYASPKCEPHNLPEK